MKTRVSHLVILIVTFAYFICANSGWAWIASEKINSADFRHEGNRFTIHASKNDHGNFVFRIHVYCSEKDAKDGYIASVGISDHGKTVFKSVYSDKRPIDRTLEDGIVFRFEIEPQYLQEAGFNFMFDRRGYWAYLKEFVGESF